MGDRSTKFREHDAVIGDPSRSSAQCWARRMNLIDVASGSGAMPVPSSSLLISGPIRLSRIGIERDHKVREGQWPTFRLCLAEVGAFPRLAAGCAQHREQATLNGNPRHQKEIMR